MKKILCLLLIVLTFGLASCGAREKTFTKNGVTITLSSDFYETEGVVGMACAYNSVKVGFMANKEKLDDFYDYDFSNKDNPKAYADLVISVNRVTPSHELINEKTNNEQYFAYTDYTNNVNGVSAHYFLVCMLGEEYAYCMNFWTAASDFDTYKDQMMEYAKTIIVE
ncbi:hypothetical protein EI71_00211 [Anaeroplasma bactoclasticum]|jgi:hypothetical protein|uniref:Lipoprotein n=1 Tax=Anaeroplasma bactoclasticum TaxID=2088 RepID=A0A397RVQ1_9MOLU|nr:hypothetical protein [Anaeroplasma bactoclasticum]RIA78263.1 hypothetical protein EI71_00211 [Anaeroplasma bactoclasticum]